MLIPKGIVGKSHRQKQIPHRSLRQQPQQRTLTKMFTTIKSSPISFKRILSKNQLNMRLSNQLQFYHKNPSQRKNHCFQTSLQKKINHWWQKSLCMRLSLLIWSQSMNSCPTWIICSTVWRTTLSTRINLTNRKNASWRKTSRVVRYTSAVW